MSCVVDYINTFNLEDYIGAYDPRDVIVLADSGYDDKKIENAIVEQTLELHYCLRVKHAVSNLKRST